MPSRRVAKRQLSAMLAERDRLDALLKAYDLVLVDLHAHGLDPISVASHVLTYRRGFVLGLVDDCQAQIEGIAPRAGKESWEVRRWV